jgi:uncharacterized protein (TIGR02611 family)
MPNRWAPIEESQLGESNSPDHENPVEEPSLGRVDRFLQRYRRTAVGRLAVAVVITVLGFAVIVVGIVLLPLPGPGWLIIFAGLAIWSLEFRWAARLRRFAVRRVAHWTRWLVEQPWWIRLLVGLGLLIVIAVIILGSLAISLGGDFVHDLRSIF